MDEATTRQIAVEAYTYLYPLMMMGVTRGPGVRCWPSCGKQTELTTAGRVS